MMIGLNFGIVASALATAPSLLSFILTAVMFGVFATGAWGYMRKCWYDAKLTSPTRRDVAAVFSSLLAALAVPAGGLAALAAPRLAQSNIPSLVAVAIMVVYIVWATVRHELAQRRWERLPFGDKVEVEAAIYDAAAGGPDSFRRFLDQVEGR